MIKERFLIIIPRELIQQILVKPEGLSQEMDFQEKDLILEISHSFKTSRINVKKKVEFPQHIKP